MTTHGAKAKKASGNQPSPAPFTLAIEVIQPAQVYTAVELSEKAPDKFTFLSQIASPDYKPPMIYLKTVANLFFDELKEKEKELIGLVSYLLEHRQSMINDSSLNMLNAGQFVRVLLAGLLDQLDFIVDLGVIEDKINLRKLILAITDPAQIKDKETNIQNLKELFKDSLKDPNIIRLFLPLYHTLFEKNNRHAENTKQAFLKLVAFGYAEGMFVKEIMDLTNEKELIKIGQILRLCREQHGLWQPLIDGLDAALPSYQPPQLSAELIEVLQKHYNDNDIKIACQNYATLDNEQDKNINAWTNYARTFHEASACRTIFDHAAEYLQEEMEALERDLTENVVDAEYINNKTKKTADYLVELIEPFATLRKALDPLRTGAKELAKAFKRFGEGFGEGSHARDRYMILQKAILDMLASLENKIPIDFKGPDDYQDIIDGFKRRLALLIAGEINKSVAGQTPLQKIMDLMSETKDDKEKKELEILGLRLIAEGADPELKTNIYRSRSATEVARDVFSGFSFMPRSLSSIELAARNGASEGFIARLSPPNSPSNSPRGEQPAAAGNSPRAEAAQSQAPKTQSTFAWLKSKIPFKAKSNEVWQTAKQYLAVHRMGDAISATVQVFTRKKANSAVKPREETVVETEEQKRSREMLVNHGYTVFRISAPNDQKPAGVPLVLRTGHTVAEAYDSQTEDWVERNAYRRRSILSSV